MKNTIFIIFIIYSFFVAKGAQRDSNKINFNFSLSVGAAIPKNDFSGAPASFHLGSQQDTLSGFAKTGFHFDFNTKIYSGYIGVEFLIGGNMNSFNTTAYNNSISYNEATTATTTANSYYIGEYMIGLCFRSNLDRKLGIHASILIGDITSNYPTLTTNFLATSTQSAGTFTWSAQNASAFGWNLNAGLNYKIQEYLNILLDISYSGATLHYSSGAYTETLQGGPTLSTDNISSIMKLGLLKPTVGVEYEL